MSQAADLFRAGLQCLTTGDLDGYLELFSDDVEYQFPFAPEGRPKGVSGGENLREYLEPIFARAEYEDISDVVVYETDVENTIVAEYTIRLRMLANSQTFTLHYIVVVRAADGRVDLYRDYWNPLGMAAPEKATTAA